jgi:hypothetical protein
MTRSRPITLLASAAVLALVGLSVAARGGVGAATASPSQVTYNGHPLELFVTDTKAGQTT